MTQLHINTLASSAITKCLGWTTGHGNANSLSLLIYCQMCDYLMNTQDQDNQEVSARNTTMKNYAMRCKAQEVDAEWTDCFILASDEQQFWPGTSLS